MRGVFVNSMGMYIEIKSQISILQSFGRGRREKTTERKMPIIRIERTNW